MNPLHRAAINVRTTIVTPYRRALSKWLATQSQAPISVLFYHRVASSNPTPWTISCEKFRRHVEYCDENYELIDLAEVQRRVLGCDSRLPAVSFTFDDGYRDNAFFALPLLIERGIPCTYFVTTSNVRNQTAFRHDTSAGKVSAVNSVRQLREASDAGIQIGCHARHHVDFSRIHDPAEVRSEIFDAKDELEQMIGKPVRYFAFPYGLPQHLTQIAIEAVAEAGFAGFCSAYGGYNTVGRDAFHIRRIHGDPEFARLKNWLGFDRRKLKCEPEVRYFLPPQRSFAETTACMSLATESQHPCASPSATHPCC
jgi:peptidoglycan/xylan/chitin deacetylase (PgdA/CDA1 family)